LHQAGVLIYHMMARVSGILKSKQNVIEQTGTCRTDFLGFSDTSCVIWLHRLSLLSYSCGG